MAAQKGRNLLIKLKNSGGTYQTVAGLRTKVLKLNSQSVDITQSDSEGGWREILPGAGVKTAQISGSGIFQDAATDGLMRAAFFNQDTPDFQIIIPNFGQIEGRFLIADMSYRGTYSGEATFDMSLNSAGPLTFTAI